MTDAKPAPRCYAVREGTVMTCEVCGFEWQAAATKPACDPITFKTMLYRMIKETDRVSASLATLKLIAAEGGPADPSGERRRLAELEAIKRTIDRCGVSPEIRELMKGII